MIINRPDIKMGAVYSDGIAFDFTDKVLPSLTTSVGLSIDRLRLLHEKLRTQDSVPKFVTPNFMLGALIPIHPNPLILIEAFKTKSGTINERIINSNYLLTALCIYSEGNWIQKSQCKEYLVLYNLFTNKATNLLGFKETKSLVSSVLKAVGIMTGRKASQDKSTKTITEKIFNGAGLHKKYKLSYTEFTDIVQNHPDFFSLLAHAKYNLDSSFYNFREFDANISKPRSTTSNIRSSHNFMRNSSDHNRKSTADTMRLVQTPRMKPTFKLPELSLKNLPKEEATHSYSSEQDQVIKAAYKSVRASKGYANEKVSYLLEKKLCAAQLDTMREWDKSLISCHKAVQSFRPFYSYIYTKPADSPRAPQRRLRRLSTTQLMPYAELFARGDIERRGLDKVDLDEIFGKYSYKNVEYIIKTFKVSSKNRLQFTDFLKMTLPEGVEIDEERAKHYYLSRVQMNSRS